jgi:integrase-like protein
LTRQDDVPQGEGGDVHSAPPAYGTAGTRLPARQLEFLAFVIDAFSRRVVGWQLAGHMRTDLVLDALRMAPGQRQPGAEIALEYHSVRGRQYTSLDYTQTMSDHGVLASVGSVGDAWSWSRRRRLALASFRSLPARVRRPVVAHPRVRSLVGSATSSRAARIVARIASDAKRASLNRGG